MQEQSRESLVQLKQIYNEEKKAMESGLSLQKQRERDRQEEFKETLEQEFVKRMEDEGLEKDQEVEVSDQTAQFDDHQ